jgi:hypothetical protein
MSWRGCAIRQLHRDRSGLCLVTPAMRSLTTLPVLAAMIDGAAGGFDQRSLYTRRISGDEFFDATGNLNEPLDFLSIASSDLMTNSMA